MAGIWPGKSQYLQRRARALPFRTGDYRGSANRAAGADFNHESRDLREITSGILAGHRGFAKRRHVTVLTRFDGDHYVAGSVTIDKLRRISTSNNQ